MVGRTLGGATIATMQGIIILLLTFLIGFRPSSFWTIPSAIFIMFLIALLFTALGTAIASFLEDFQGFQLIMNFLVMPLFFLSGALFPIQSAPGFLQTVAGVNPLSFGVDGLRTTLTGFSHFGLSTDLAVLVILTAILFALGSYLFTKIQI